MDKLNILWTTDNKDTALNMISMYSNYAYNQGWWKEIEIIIWGASAKLVGTDPEIQDEVLELINLGITVRACLSCSDKAGVTDKLKEMGIDLQYMGEPLTRALKNNEKILTI